MSDARVRNSSSLPRRIGAGRSQGQRAQGHSPATAPRPSLIQYAPPESFQSRHQGQQQEPSSSAQSSRSTSHTDEAHDHVAPDSVDHASRHPSTHHPKSSSSSSGGGGLLHGLEVGSEKVLQVLRRGERSHGPLVEDHVLETMDFDKDEDYVNEDFMEKRSALHRRFTLFLQFIMTVAIAFVTAVCMYIVIHGVEFFFDFKIESTLHLIEEAHDAWRGYFTYLFMNLLYTGIAAALVAIIAPMARGGGVPFVQAYLNGTNLMESFTPRIVVIKTFSLLFTIAGGLPLGQEGPFVHIGGGVAAAVTRSVDYLIPLAYKSYSKLLRSIREERIFMAGGIAAGLAVAFDSPIAGVLFSLEGSTAFLSASVILRLFGCAMFAEFFNNLNHTNYSAAIKNHNLLQVTNSGVLPEYAWTVLEIIPFTIIAILGGIIGAMATKINMIFSRWRHHSMHGTTPKDVLRQIFEVMAFTFFHATFMYSLPFLFGCRPVHKLCSEDVPALPTRCVQGQCPDGYFSEAATIVFSPPNGVAALLFDRSLSWERGEEYHVAPLFCYGLIYTLIMSSLYGSYVPGGLFMPSIVIGGCFGRIVGIIARTAVPSSSINPGVYALLGASSMLGGFTRLALPIVIMLVEMTGDATYMLPIMFCGVVGKLVSDWIEPPLYPQHMAMEKIPILTDKVNPILAKLTAKEIMLPAARCQTMCTVERLSHVKDVLMKSRRIVFPLETPEGNFAGLILRRNVMICVAQGKTYPSFDLARAEGGRVRSHDSQTLGRSPSPVRDLFNDWRKDKLDYAATLTHRPGKGGNVDDELDDASWINFRPYMDGGCLTARPDTPAKRLAILFRRVGLSHLCITDKNNVFQGLITRRALITPHTGAAATPKHGTAHDSDPDHGHDDDASARVGHGSHGKRVTNPFHPDFPASPAHLIQDDTLHTHNPHSSRSVSVSHSGVQVEVSPNAEAGDESDGMTHRHTYHQRQHQAQSSGVVTSDDGGAEYRPVWR